MQYLAEGQTHKIIFSLLKNTLEISLQCKMLKNIIILVISLNSVICRLRTIPPCLEMDEIKPAVNEFNFTRFIIGTWYNMV